MVEGDKAASDAVCLILIKVHDHSRIQLLSCKAKLQSCKTKLHCCHIKLQSWRQNCKTKLHGRNVKLQICKFARENCKTARQSCTVTLSSCKFARLQNQAAMLPVLSLDPIPYSQVNILKNQRSPQKKQQTASQSSGALDYIRGENAERQSPQLCERTRRPGKPVNPRKAGWEMVGNNPQKIRRRFERGESAWHRRR